VAELVDALVSKTSSFQGVPVRSRPWVQKTKGHSLAEPFFYKMYYVYILYSPSSEYFYKGQTNDIRDRLRRHNSGSEKFTSKGKPWILIWVTEKPNRSQAIKLERKLKNLSRSKTIEFIFKYKDGCAGPDALIHLDQLSGC
jgi:putative endonuclease